MHFRESPPEKQSGAFANSATPQKGPVFCHELRNRKTFAYVTTGDRVPLIKRAGQRYESNVNVPLSVATETVQPDKNGEADTISVAGTCTSADRVQKPLL